MENKMKLIDLYLEDIRKRLPPRNREDILNEIHSTLMDMIEDRNPRAGEPHDEETVKSVLKEFGSPRKVAQQYSRHNYLIGPEMFPTYLQVLKIVLIVIAGLNLFGIIMAIVGQTGVGESMFEAIAEVFAGLFSSLFSGFGVVTLVFASIERTVPEQVKIKVEQDWSPDDLLEQEDRHTIKITELALEITFTLVFIVLINFFLDRIGIYYLGESGWVSAPILNENFLRYIPWITAVQVLSIILALYLIRRGYRDKISALAKLFINAFSIALNFAILTGADVITVTQSAWQALNFDLAITAEQLTRGMNIGLDVILGLAIFGLVVESIKLIYESFIKGSHTRIEIETD
jgi:hypothetical protein